MFVICFGDGLGNQMFQYAFYKAMQHNYPCNDVKMDIFHIYGGHIHNGFELSTIFNIPVNECYYKNALALSDYFPRHLKKYWLLNRLSGVRRYFFGQKESYIEQEDPTCYYEEVFQLSELKSYILKGNWVNEKYFSKYRNELIKDFSFPEFDEPWNLHYVEKIKDTNAVSVHIRKGDYVNSGMLNLDIQYYRKAKSIIESEVKNPVYYIFTDEKSSILEYLKIFEKYTLIEGNSGNKSYRDMQLMSLCKHNIIANSTFSFWGAYLNDNEDRIVIAPNKAKYDFRNPFACKEWIIIPYNGETKAEVPRKE